MSESVKQYLGDTLRFAAIVLLIGSIVRVGASIYLPAMPIIGEELHSSDAMMSHTLTLYFIVFAVFSLLAGALSDAYGRKIVLQSGMTFFIIGSMLCATADSYEALLAGRAVQAFGASMIPGTLIAMVRDACSDKWVVSLIGWLAVLSGLFLVVAPLIGGILTQLLGWTSNFWFLALFTTVVWLAAYFNVEETHPTHKRIPIGLKRTLVTAGKMVISADFTLVMMPVIAFFAIQGAFLAAAPYIVMGQYKLTPVEFGLSNIVIVIGLFSGRWVGSHLLNKYDAKASYRISGLSSLAVALLYFTMGIGLVHGLAYFLGIVSIFGVVFGMTSPIGMKSSLSAFRETSGIAAALQGALMFAASAVGSAAFGGILNIFPTLDAEASFGLVSAMLCVIAGVAAIVSRHRLQ